MHVAIILCEGPEDLAALRELLKYRWGLRSLPSIDPPVGERRLQVMETPTRRAVLKVVKGAKSDLVNALRHEVEAAQNKQEVDSIGVNFDPDFDTEAQWRKSLFPYPRDPTSADDHMEQPVRIVPLPWNVVSATAPPVSNATQVAMEHLLWMALADTHPGMKTLVESWLPSIPSARPATLSSNWKTAVRLCHALRMPDKGVADVATQVFGQDKALWAAIESTLKDSALWAGLTRLFGPPTA